MHKGKGLCEEESKPELVPIPPNSDGRLGHIANSNDDLVAE